MTMLLQALYRDDALAHVLMWYLITSMWAATPEVLFCQA